MIDCTVLTDRRYVGSAESQYEENVRLEDGLVMDALRRQGLAVDRRAWDDPEVIWQESRLALFRTTWDYFDRWSEFSSWLDRASAHTTMVNPSRLVRWNLDKRYLTELADAGVDVVGLQYVEPGDHRPLSYWVGGRPEVVVKPAISGGGRDTFRVRGVPTPADEERWRALVSVEGMLVQPFVESVLTRGEVSLIWIDGQITHGVRKIAAPGEFRVQDDHGGTVEEYAPSVAERALADRAIGACPVRPVYARVDLVEGEHGPLVMELELVEPELFFRFQPHAADVLAAGVARLL